MLDDNQRAMYKERLRVELAQFRERENLYTEKRAELIELELYYRRN